MKRIFKEGRDSQRGGKLVDEVILQGKTDNILGGPAVFRKGALPNREAFPDGVTVKKCQQLEDAQRNGRNIDKALIRLNLSKDRSDVICGLAVQVLVLRVGSLLWHGHEPKVIEEAPEGELEFPKLDLNLETEPVDLDDGLWAKAGVGANEDSLVAVWVDGEDNAGENAAPHEVSDEERHMFDVTVEREIGGFEEFWPTKISGQVNLFSELLGAPGARLLGGRDHRMICHGVASESADDNVAGGHEGGHEGLGCVVGIGNHNSFKWYCFSYEYCHFVNKGCAFRGRTLDAILQDEAQRQGIGTGQVTNERRKCAPEMAADEFWLAVGFRLLVEKLDRRHLASFLGNFDGVNDINRPSFHAQASRRAEHDQLSPPTTKCLDLKSGGMEEAQKAMILSGRKPHAAHYTCYTSTLQPHHEGPQNGHKQIKRCTTSEHASELTNKTINNVNKIGVRSCILLGSTHIFQSAPLLQQHVQTLLNGNAFCCQLGNFLVQTRGAHDGQGITCQEFLGSSQ